MDPGAGDRFSAGNAPEDDEQLLHWSDAFLAFDDPGVSAAIDIGEAFSEIINYTQEQIRRRRANPTNDLLNALIDVEVDAERLDEAEIAGLFTQLMSAGADSTRSACGTTMHALLQDREQLELLRAQPDLISAAVEEGLRCFPPFPLMGRTATRDIELHGQQIKEGDRLALWFMAANRDPDVLVDPHRFDITRPELDTHQSFGAGGLHFCLGASLARLELRVWVAKTLERLPDLEVAGEPTRVQALAINQYSSEPVRRTGLAGS